MKRLFSYRKPAAEVSPEDWRQFLRLALVSVAIMLAFTFLYAGLIRLVIGWTPEVARLGLPVSAAVGIWWSAWYMSFDARRRLDSERLRHGMPNQPVSYRLAVMVALAVTAVIVVLLGVAFADRLTEPRMILYVVGSPLTWLALGPILAWTERRKVFASPRTRAMLDGEWARMHGAIDPSPRPHHGSNSGTPA